MSQFIVFNQMDVEFKLSRHDNNIDLLVVASGNSQCSAPIEVLATGIKYKDMSYVGIWTDD